MESEENRTRRPLPQPKSGEAGLRPLDELLKDIQSRRDNYANHGCDQVQTAVYEELNYCAGLVEDAIAAWNRRTPSHALEGLRKERDELKRKLGEGPARVQELQRQLDDAREDSQLLNKLEKLSQNEFGDVVKISTFSNGEVHLVLHDEPLAIAPSLRAALNAAKGQGG